MLKETKTSDYYWLKRGKTSRRKLESILKKRPVDLVLLCGHGTANAVEGNGEYILDTNNNELLRGKVVHALSCRSAAELGPDSVAKGAQAYIGYREDFIAVLDESRRISKPLEDKLASLFLTPAFTAPKALLRGGSPDDAIIAARKAYNKSIRDALNSDIQSDADQFINYLLWDRDNLVLHSKNKT